MIIYSNIILYENGCSVDLTDFYFEHFPLTFIGFTILYCPQPVVCFVVFFNQIPLEISYTYKGRLARDFGGIFEYFWRHVNLVVANPIELCDVNKARNAQQLNGNFDAKIITFDFHNPREFESSFKKVTVKL